MDVQSTGESIRHDRKAMANDTVSMLNDSEPIYENFLRVDNVSIFDHRVIGVMKSVNNAPQQIREETERFFSVINNLKHVYTCSLAKQTKARERYTKVVARYEDIERALYEAINREDPSSIFSYDDFSTPPPKVNNSRNTFVKSTDQNQQQQQRLKENLDKCHVELMLARNILDSAERELEIHREQLCLFTKKAEHSLMCFLRKTTDTYLPKNTIQNTRQIDDVVSTDDGRNRYSLDVSLLPPPQFLQIDVDEDEGRITDHFHGSGSSSSITTTATTTNKSPVPNSDSNSGSGETRKSSATSDGGNSNKDDVCSGFSGFEWDNTFDDHLHTYQHLPLLKYHDTSVITSDGEDNDDDLYYDPDDEIDDDIMVIKNNDNDINKTDYFQSAISTTNNNNKANRHGSEPLYDDLILYRRRCALVQCMKPSRLMKYLKTVIHGPWEGWEDL